MLDYKFGLGKDRRILTRYHTTEWMRHVVVPAQKPRYGQNNGYCKLTREQVDAIRKDKEHTGPYLAKLYGVTKAHIYRIQKRKTRRYG